MKAWITAAVTVFGLTSCGSLPNEQQVARRYEHEHPGRKVVQVTTSSKGEGISELVDFRVAYTDLPIAAPHVDHVRYSHGAEGGWGPLPPKN